MGQIFARIYQVRLYAFATNGMKAIGMIAGIKIKAKRLKPNKEETY